MESSGAPSKTRSKALFAILVIVLLVVGFGAGYLLGRPASPGPVDNLARTNTVPRVSGWYRGVDVTYLDYGPELNVSLPILVFFQAAAPDTPFAGQKNIIDTIPGQPGYSDFWRVHKVLVPTGYVANSIRSFEDAVKSGYTIQATNTIVNCPVVNPNARIQGSSQTPTTGWYRGRDVFYFDHGTNSPGKGFLVQDAPIYAFFHTNGSAVAGQRNVIDVRPGETGYSDLWRVTIVIVDTTYSANTLKAASDILAAANMGTLTVQATNTFVNCPVVP